MVAIAAVSETRNNKTWSPKFRSVRSNMVI